jgi:hypothetical protein
LLLGCVESERVIEEHIERKDRWCKLDWRIIENELEESGMWDWETWKRIQYYNWSQQKRDRGENLRSERVFGD